MDTKGRVLAIRLNEADLAAMREKADREGITLSFVARAGLRAWVNGTLNIGLTVAGPLLTGQEKQAVEKEGKGKPGRKEKEKRYTETVCAKDEVCQPIGGLIEVGMDDSGRSIFIDKAGNMFNHMHEPYNPETGDVQEYGKPKWWKEMEVAE